MYKRQDPHLSGPVLQPGRGLKLRRSCPAASLSRGAQGVLSAKPEGKNAEYACVPANFLPCSTRPAQRRRDGRCGDGWHVAPHIRKGLPVRSVQRTGRPFIFLRVPLSCGAASLSHPALGGNPRFSPAPRRGLFFPS